MQFFEAISGDRYPISAIRKIGKARKVNFRPRDRQGFVHTVDLEGGESCEVEEHEMHRINATPAHVIAAPASTNLVRWDDEAPEEVWRTSIIAWAITMDGSMAPITADGVNDGNPLTTEVDVELPDGSVTSPYVAWWPTVDDWRREKQAKHEERKAQQSGVTD